MSNYELNFKKKKKNSNPDFVGVHSYNSSDHRLIIINYGGHLESSPLMFDSEFDGDVNSMSDLSTYVSGLGVSICEHSQ